MINTAAKFTFAIAVAAFVTSIGYGIAVGDRTGSLLFVSLGVVAVLLALAEAGSGGNDFALRADPDTPPATVPVGRTAAPPARTRPLGGGGSPGLPGLGPAR